MGGAPGAVVAHRVQRRAPAEREVQRQARLRPVGANRNMLVLAQIESKQAHDNLASILSVPGLTGITGGPHDLAASLGHPGEPVTRNASAWLRTRHNRRTHHQEDGPERHDGQHWSARVDLQCGPHFCCSAPAGCVCAPTGTRTSAQKGTRTSAQKGTRNAWHITTGPTLSGQGLRVAFATMSSAHQLRPILG